MSRLFTLTAILTISALACGGSAYRPQPLKHHFDEKHLVRVEVEKKETMLSAQAAYERARNAQLKAEADLEDQNSEIKKAEDERKEADIRKRAAQDQRKTAEKTEDLNRINPAMREERVADLRKRTAEKHLRAAKARKAYLQKRLNHAMATTYLLEAKFELAKAMVARQNNIAPRGVIFERFETQLDRRKKESEKTKSEAAREKEAADKAHLEWQAQYKEYKHAEGAAPASKAKEK